MLQPTNLLFNLANAQGQADPIYEKHGLPAPAPFLDIKGTLLDYVQWIMGIFWLLTVALIIWAAFLYLTAGGSEDKITEAKKRLLYAVIAAAIALLATGIDLIVYYLLGGSI